MLFCAPMPLGRKARPFNDPEWIFELKYDGFRALAVVEYGSCTLFSRNGHTFASFADLATRIGNALMPRFLVLDGEIVCIDDRGHCQFNETVDRDSKTNLDEALRLISDTNTAMYSFNFSSTRAAVSHEASKFSSSTPGPAHGCFSRDGADREYDWALQQASASTALPTIRHSRKRTVPVGRMIGSEAADGYSPSQKNGGQEGDLPGR